MSRALPLANRIQQDNQRNLPPLLFGWMGVTKRGGRCCHGNLPHPVTRYLKQFASGQHVARIGLRMAGGRWGRSNLTWLADWGEWQEWAANEGWVYRGSWLSPNQETLRVDSTRARGDSLCGTVRRMFQNYIQASSLPWNRVGAEEVGSNVLTVLMRTAGDVQLFSRTFQMHRNSLLMLKHLSRRSTSSLRPPSQWWSASLSLLTTKTEENKK